jgi:Matrixin
MTQATLLRRFVALAGFAIVVGCFFSQVGRAYVLEGESWPAGSVVTFQMALGNAGRTLSDGNTSWDLAAQPAPGVWDGVMQRLQFISTTNPSAPISSGDHVNVVAFSNTVFGQSFGSGTLAVTYYRSSGSTMIEADVLFNIRQNFDSYRGPLRYGTNGYAIADIRRVLIHELGHALGLDHPDQHGQHVSAIMNSRISDLETVTSDDINGAQRLYGVGQPNPTPTPTPTPAPTATPNPTPTPRATPVPSVTLPTISVSVSPPNVRRGGSATFAITISNPRPSPVTVNYMMSGRAILGRQYRLSGSPGQATIPAGASSANVTLTAVAAAKRPRVATMILIPNAAYDLSAPTSASLRITR